MAKIQGLVGPATREDLRAVECYVGSELGVFIPSVGHCGYASRKGHTHPAWSFILYFLPEDAHIPREIEVPESHTLAVAMTPGIAHEEGASDTFGRYAAVQAETAFFSRVWALYSPEPPPRCDWRQFTVHADVFLYLKRFMNECDAAPPGSALPPPLAIALEEPIVHLVARGLAASLSFAGSASGTSATVATSIGMRRVTEHIERHYAETIAVSSLAALAGLSSSAFTRRFHEETGLTPAEYVAEVRIRKAKLMLDDPAKSVTDVAHACGFYDASHFSSSFLKATGMSPKRYASLFAKAGER